MEWLKNMTNIWGETGEPCTSPHFMKKVSWKKFFQTLLIYFPATLPQNGSDTGVFLDFPFYELVKCQDQLDVRDGCISTLYILISNLYPTYINLYPTYIQLSVWNVVSQQCLGFNYTKHPTVKVLCWYVTTESVRLFKLRVFMDQGIESDSRWPVHHRRNP